MSFRLLLSTIAPVITGLCIVELVAPTLRSTGLLYWVFSASVGFGFDALVFFWFRRPFVTVEWILLAGWVGLIYFLRKRRTELPEIAATTDLPYSGVLLFVPILIGLTHFVFVTLNEPHGGWDAWAIWNLHARFLVRGGPEWYAKLATIGFTNPDYPLLVPSIIARSWRFAGTETTLVPITVALAFTAFTTATLFGLVQKIRPGIYASLATVVLIGTPFFITNGALQYADIPLGFFIIAALGLIWLYEDDRVPHSGLLILAGFFAGLAGWTKNEGVVFVLALVVAYTAATIPKGFLSTAKCLAWIGAGALPALITVVYFKLAMAPRGVLFHGQTIDAVVSRSVDIQRHGQIVKAIVSHLWIFGGWFYAPVPIVLLYFFLQRYMRPKACPGTSTSTMTLVLLLASYYVVYLFTPIPLSDHLASSVDRLLMQLWPAFVFVTFAQSGIRGAGELPQQSYQPPYRWYRRTVKVISVPCLAALLMWIYIARPHNRGSLNIPELLRRSAITGYFVVESNSGSPLNVRVKISNLNQGSSVDVQPSPLMKDVSINIGEFPWTDIGLAIANPNDVFNLITLTVVRDHNDPYAQEMFGLLPGYQVAKLLSEFVPKVPVLSPNTVLRLQSTVPFALLVLKNRESTLSSMPLEIHQRVAGPLVFPQFAMFGGWLTEITLVNSSSSLSNGRVILFNPEHQPLKVNLNSLENDIFEYSVPPGDTIRFSPINTN